MIIKTLTLKNFRNYENKSFNFDSVTTLIVGPNTSGKSNLLESIFVLSNGKSNRADYDMELIRKGEKLSIVSCLLSVDYEVRKLEMFLSAKDSVSNLSSKIFRINGVGKRLSTFVGNLNSVLFTPEDLQIITDSPSTRRDYLNTVLSQVHEDYRRAFLSYSKVLKQRNKLLEKIFERKAGIRQLPFWNVKLLEAGKILHDYRSNFFKFINEKINSVASELFERKKLSVYYKENPITGHTLEEGLRKDIQARTTTSGPHREDFEFLIHTPSISRGPVGTSLHAFGSRGQQRSAVLVLKLLELSYIQSVLGHRPVLLLDDIFSELDHEHRKKVVSLLSKQQTIITTADIHHVEEEYRRGMKIIEL